MLLSNQSPHHLLLKKKLIKELMKEVITKMKCYLNAEIKKRSNFLPPRTMSSSNMRVIYINAPYS